MKKEIIATFVIALSFGLVLNASAFSESYESPVRNSRSNVRIQRDSNKKLDNAMQSRWYYYQKNKIRGEEYSNRLSQIQRHHEGQKSIGVNAQSTVMDREGILNFSPYYRQERSNSKSSINAPNNAKRNFRARAINYYIDGGNAGTDILKSNVILSSEHVIPQIPFSLKREKKPMIDYAITKPIRDVQKFEMKTTDQVPAGEQKTTFRIGDFSRNLFHPFMFGTNDMNTGINDEEKIEYDGGFFSTEAE